MNFKKFANNYKTISNVSEPEPTQFYCWERDCVKRPGGGEWDWDCPVSVKRFEQGRCVCNNDAGYVGDDANTTCRIPTEQFYCAERGCTDKGDGNWDCPVSVKHFNQNKCVCNNYEGYVKNDSNTACNFQEPPASTGQFYCRNRGCSNTVDDNDNDSWHCPISVKHFYKNKCICNSDQGYLQNDSNSTCEYNSDQFYCGKRCDDKGNFDWACPKSVKHHSQNSCFCNEDEGYVLNDAKTSCNYQCTIYGADARKQPDNSYGAENYFSWNKIGEKNYCVRYKPSPLHRDAYDPSIEHNLDPGPVNYCNSYCNGDATPEESADLSQKGFAFKSPQCDWDNNDCYANLVDNTTIPQPTYPNPNPVTYLYAQNIETNIPAPYGQPTVCFTDKKPSSAHYKNFYAGGNLFDPRFKSSHPYPKMSQ